eukprot:1373507-Amorphochlora_amoeboformis.AAC.1
MSKRHSRKGYFLFGNSQTVGVPSLSRFTTVTAQSDIPFLRKVTPRDISCSPALDPSRYRGHRPWDKAFRRSKQLKRCVAFYSAFSRSRRPGLCSHLSSGTNFTRFMPHHRPEVPTKTTMRGTFNESTSESARWKTWCGPRLFPRKQTMLGRGRREWWQGRPASKGKRRIP